MRTNLRKIAILLVCALFFGATPANHAAWAQDQGNAVNCDPVTDPDPDVQFTANLCSAHPGCALVMKLQRACTATKTFFKKIGDLFTLDSSKPLTNNDIMEAASPTPAPNPTVKRYVAQANALVRTALSDPAAREVHVYNPTSGKAVYQGKVNAQGNPDGYGVVIHEDGKISRGQYADGQLDGPGQILLTAPQQDGITYMGTFKNGFLDGPGASQNKEGSAGTGEFVKGKPVGMLTFTYADGRTSMILYDETGKFVAEGPIAKAGQKAVAPPVPADIAARLAALTESRRAAAAAPRAGQATTVASPRPQMATAAPRPASGVSGFTPVACNRAAALAAMKIITNTRRADDPDNNPEHWVAQMEKDAAATPESELRKLDLTSDNVRPAPVGTLGLTGDTTIYSMCLVYNRAVALQSGGSPAPAPPSSAGGASSRSAASGLPYAECERQDRTDPVAARLNALGSDNVLKMRGIIATLDVLTRIYRQCLPDSRAQAKIDGFRSSRESTLTTCKQIAASPQTCEVSPF